MPDLRVGVLGTLEVHVDGHPRVVPPGRQRAVLTCLLARAGQPVSAEALIDAAWGTDRPQNPPKALRTVLSRLRAVLGQDAITLGPAGYQLRVDALDCDEFEALLDRSRSAPPHQARELLEQGLALWRGPAYGEYADASFATSRAQSLEQARMDAIEEHAAALLQTGEPSATVPDLQDLLAEQPFRERAVELLVTALYHAGRQTEALERLRTFRAQLRSELGLDPSPALTALESRILGHALAPVRAAEPALPEWLDTSTAFIGREDELADVLAAVSTSRVTVVTGPGGVGKSRLAAEALGGLHQSLGLPVAVVELAPVVPGRVTLTLMDLLGLRPTGAGAGTPETDVDGASDARPRAGADSAVGDLVEYLGAVPHLLMLDNCEHVLNELTPVVSEIASRCRDVRVLATSRRRLGVASEQVLPLAPLGTPDATESLGRQGSAGSVRLFGDRVRRLRPAFALTADNLPEVAELCRRCEGLPLALELAASRTARSGVGEVLRRLPTDAVGETGGLWSVVAWSDGLLAPDQQRLLDCLTVFADDFTAPDVANVVSRLPGWTGDPAPALAELVESSLVVPRDATGEPRYGLLEMVRAFAARRLQESGRAEEVGAAHGAWVRELVTGIRQDWTRLDGAVVGARLSAASSEVTGALRRALEAGQLVLAADISHAVARCLHWTPGLELRDLMIEVGERCAQTPGPEVAGGVAAAAFGHAERGDPARARALATAALDMSRESDAAAMAHLALAVAAMYAGELADSARWFRGLAADPALLGEANTSLALIACYCDDLVGAREHAQIALAAGSTGSDASHAFARYAAGEVAARTDPTTGVQLLTAAAAEADRVGAEQVSRVARVALFALLVRAGRDEEAAALGLRVCADLRRLGAWTQSWTLVRMLAELVAEAGRWSDAAFLLGAAAGAAGAPPPVGQDIQRYAELQATLSAHLGTRVVEQILALAAATPRAQVLSRAERLLAELSTARPASASQ
ncbi:BTAD domain-containing putative transcriptional regulator [Ornithinimicrobium murale]|uniref:BTAD domain-containing putative transcriptional regulator n=1 Tax=Ornithinimicrobium murale TaxID=1050153 RepID=UPI0013B43BA0|nr:BTAD domain-containing putative transcriptional regulator [Ornithinimicrobium murale]